VDGGEGLLEGRPFFGKGKKEGGKEEKTFFQKEERMKENLESK
jgi:hypothetical protein